MSKTLISYVRSHHTTTSELTNNHHQSSGLWAPQLLTSTGSCNNLTTNYIHTKLKDLVQVELKIQGSAYNKSISTRKLFRIM